jgi:hypothetical protein
MHIYVLQLQEADVASISFVIEVWEVSLVVFQAGYKQKLILGDTEYHVRDCE